MSYKEVEFKRENSLCKSHGGGKNERALFQRSVISKLTRLELEDKFFRAIESNVMLKRQNNFQDEKLKLLSTKLVRLSEQLKRESSHNLAFQPFEKLVKEQEMRIMEMEKTNMELLQRINVLKKQASVQQYIVALSKSNRTRRGGSVQTGTFSSSYTPRSSKTDHCDSSKHAAEDLESEKSLQDNKHLEQTEPEESNFGSPEEDYVYSSTDNEDTSRKHTNIVKLETVKEENSDVQERVDVQSKKTLDTKSMLVQTDLTKSYYDDMSRRLLEKETTILELQNKLKLSRIKQNVIGEVENLFNIINQKSTTKDVSRKKKKNSKKDDDGNKILHELQMERIHLQTQKTINEQLLKKLSDMQKQLDNYSISFGHTDDVNLYYAENTPRSVGDRTIISNEIDNKETYIEEPLTLDIVSEIHDDKITNIDNENVENQSEAIEVKDSSQNDDPDEDGEIIREDNGSEGEVIMQGDIEESAIENLLGDVDEKLNTAEEDIKSNTESNEESGKIVENKDREINDETYDISNRSDTMTPSIGSSCGSSCGQCLSDGEVPRGKSDRSESEDTESSDKSPHFPDVARRVKDANNDMFPEKGEVIPVDVKAEMTLKAISEQLETCKMLIAAPYNY